MRRFLISSPNFIGQVEMVFNFNGELMSLHLGNANLTIGQIKYLLKNTPLIIDDLQTAFASSKAIIVESNFEVTFDMFWNKYDLKRNKKPAEKIWVKMNTVDKVKAYHSINAYNKYLKRNDWCNRLYPDTYLRNEHYNNEWDKLK